MTSFLSSYRLGKDSGLLHPETCSHVNLGAVRGPDLFWWKGVRFLLLVELSVMKKGSLTCLAFVKVHCRGVRRIKT